MQEAEATTYHINPFDLTKVWSHADYPVIEIGELELNRNPVNYFAESRAGSIRSEERCALWASRQTRWLQGRLIGYPDGHRYRIGVNYNLLPINEAKCPYATYNRDGRMRFGDNGGSGPNYEPNSFGGPTQDKKYLERPVTINSATVGRYDHCEHDGDYYTQPGNLFRLMTPDTHRSGSVGTARLV